MAEKQQEKKKSEKEGRNDTKCKRYRANKTREKNKLKRVLQSEGLEAAKAYAEAKEIWGYLKKLLG
jgi:hypothetical protein